MSDDSNQISHAIELRQQAEEQLKNRPHEWTAPMSVAEVQQLLHELQVHQIELELQNEELRDARVELEAGLERYRELYDFAPIGLFALGRTGSIAQVNLAGAALLHHERARLMGVPFASFVAEGGRREMQSLCDQIFSGETRRSCELKLRQTGHPDRIVLVEATLSPDGEQCRCVVLDVTERRQLEQQVLRNQRVESIGTLASGIAHDINNVLTPILLSIELLKMRLPDAESRELLESMDSSARHGADLTRQILFFARGGQSQHLPVSTSHLLREVLAFIHETFLRQIEVRTAFTTDLWAVMGDPTQLRQVLINLCVNARDAMPHGGTLIISAKNHPLPAAGASLDLSGRAGPHILVEISDTGTGIAPELLERIFDPFFTTKELGKGTGLGLSTSFGIIKSHGGLLLATSELGEGAKFSIYLPAHPCSTPVAPAVAAPAEPTAEKSILGRGELILIVDDEPGVRQVTQQALLAFGYTVVIAQDGAEALRIYARQRQHIAAVITDMMMPVMDGTRTIAALRSLNPRVKIIAASGVFSADPAAEAARLGVQQFLPKPYSTSALLQALRDALPD